MKILGGGRQATLVLLAVCLLAIPGTPASASSSATGAGSRSDRTVIGHSVLGRPIVAVDGRGPAAASAPPLKILVVGCIHGNETAGMGVARRLIATAAPRGVEQWVLPTLNPDGVAADTRGNAHGVDLNRNFSFDWAHLGGGEYSGTGPLSEPESRAAERLIRHIRPDLTIWFHQPFGIVDRSGGDPFVERRFSQLVGLPLVRLHGRYPGSATRWQNHAFPTSTAFVVELPAAASPALIARATAAVRTLAAELASPRVDRALPFPPIGPET